MYIKSQLLALQCFFKILIRSFAYSRNNRLKVNTLSYDPSKLYGAIMYVKAETSEMTSVRRRPGAVLPSILLLGNLDVTTLVKDSGP